MPERSYFDWNATAPLRDEARAAIAEALSVPGNPSSVHAEGRAARRLIEKAREEVATLVGARAGDVFFTSSGTEANMLALTPAIEVAGDRFPRSKLLLSAVEHISGVAGGRFAREAIEELPVDAQSRLDLAALAEAVAKSPRALVSLMLANNETGPYLSKIKSSTSSLRLCGKSTSMSGSLWRAMRSRLRKRRK